MSFAGRAQQDIVDLLARGVVLGRRVEVTALLRMIDDDLHRQPREWGDPLRNFRSLQMVQYRGRHHPLIAYYTVHERLPLVVLSHMAVHPDHPLAGP